MAKLLEFPGARGAVTIAVREPDDMVAPVGMSDRIRERIDTSLESVLAMTASVAESFQNALQDAPVESGEIEFGLQFTGGGNAYIIEIGSAASLVVRLRVSPPS